MIITSVSKPKKHLVSVCFDDGTEACFDMDYAAEAGFAPGMELTFEQVQLMVAQSDKRRAFSRACYYLADSDFSRLGMFQRLKKASFSEEASEDATRRLCDLGIINDERYAAHLAESLLSKNISAREALYKMMNKGLSKEIARAALEEIETDPETQIIELIRKKFAEKLSRPDGTQKVFAALMRKGFQSSDIRSALRRYSNGEIDITED